MVEGYDMKQLVIKRAKGLKIICQYLILLVSHDSLIALQIEKSELRFFLAILSE